MATYKFIQKNVIGCCPESLLSGIMQHHFVIPVLKRPMEMPGCEWNPFSAALGRGSTILLSNSHRVNKEPAEQGSASDSVPKGGWFSHSRYAILQTALPRCNCRVAFPIRSTSDRYCLIWQMLLFLGHGSINIGFNEEEFIGQLLCFLIRFFDSKDCWNQHQNTCFWRIPNSL